MWRKEAKVRFPTDWWDTRYNIFEGNLYKVPWVARVVFHRQLWGEVKLFGQIFSILNSE